jgi:hypothetical protein
MLQRRCGLSDCAAVAALATACSGDSGALGQVAFSPECALHDLSCLAVGLDAPIAVGGRVALVVDTETAGSGAPTVHMSSVREDVLAVEGRELVARSPGVAAVLVSADELVLDFIHVWVEEPTGIAVHRHDGDGLEVGEISGLVELLVGDELVVSAQTYADSQRLMGANDPAWSVSSTSVTVLRQGDSARRRLVARSPGSATVTVDELGFSSSVEIEVLP